MDLGPEHDLGIHPPKKQVICGKIVSTIPVEHDSGRWNTAQWYLDKQRAKKFALFIWLQVEDLK